MKLRLLLSFMLCAVAITGFSQLSVGIIGTATPGGWSTDTDLTPNPDSSHLWSITMTLTQGECKFRANDDWAVNWGATAFPTGVGIQGGPNIPVPATGEYTVHFNSNTGAYNFIYTSDIGIIGSATPGGWDNDTDLYQDVVDTNKYFLVLNLTQGAAKFRANNAWATNWGATGFPQDTGVQNGPDIPIPVAGKYRVDFDKATGIYNFTEVIEFASIGLLGDATGSWDVDTNLVRDPGNPDLWKGTFDLLTGGAKFRANDAWALNWGNTGFPTDTAVLNGDNIPVEEGRYQVRFNTKDLVYSFLKIEPFTSIGIIGNATPGGWDTETPLEKDLTQEGVWRKRMILLDGFAKFRANNDWTTNWGSGDFPTGTGIQDGADIPVVAGEYKIAFNSITGEYTFELLVVFSTVGLVGPSTPLASWDIDVDMTKDATNESFWVIPSVDLTDGEVKFRAEDGWAVNWGATDWPSGLGTQDGPNIPVSGGTYRVTLNSAEGQYAFSDPSSTVDLLMSNSVRFAPNPADDVLNITVDADQLKGDVQVVLFNQMGQRVLTQQLNIQSTATFNVARLVPGTYTVQISNAKNMVGKTVVIK